MQSEHSTFTHNSCFSLADFLEVASDSDSDSEEEEDEEEGSLDLGTDMVSQEP